MGASAHQDRNSNSSEPVLPIWTTLSFAPLDRNSNSSEPVLSIGSETQTCQSLFCPSGPKLKLVSARVHIARNKVLVIWSETQTCLQSTSPISALVRRLHKRGGGALPQENLQVGPSNSSALSSSAKPSNLRRVQRKLYKVVKRAEPMCGCLSRSQAPCARRGAVNNCWAHIHVRVGTPRRR